MYKCYLLCTISKASETIVISLGRKVVRFNDCYAGELDCMIIRALQLEFVLENGEI